jgi:N-acetylneuraminic acid mutarotase
MTLIAAAALCATSSELHVEAISPGRVARIADMTESRASHTMTLLADGRVYIAGGFAGNDTEASPFRSTELFDPATNRFTAGPSFLAGKTGHTATLLPDGRVLVVGGWTGHDAAAFGGAEIQDPVGGRAPELVRPIVRRAGHTATQLRDGRVLLLGGVDQSGRELRSAEVFDPRTGKFAAVADMRDARAAHTATLLADGRVAVIGGGDGRYPDVTVHRSVEVFDPATNSFVVAGELAVARHKHAAALLDDGRVVIVGGSDNRDWRGRYESGEVFDPGTGRSTPTSPMGAKRFKHSDAIVPLGSGRVLVAGGGASAEIFETSSGRFHRADGSLDEARFYSTAVTLKDGRVLIVGGYAEGGALPATRKAYVFTDASR